MLLLLSSLASTITEHRRGADEKHSEGNKNGNKPPREEEEESPTPPWVHFVLHLNKACSIYTKNCQGAELQKLREAPPILGIWSCNNNISHIQDYLFTVSKRHPGLIYMNLGK
jgi:hypothetical protein